MLQIEVSDYSFFNYKFTAMERLLFPLSHFLTEEESMLIFI